METTTDTTTVPQIQPSELKVILEKSPICILKVTHVDRSFNKFLLKFLQETYGENICFATINIVKHSKESHILMEHIDNTNTNLLAPSSGYYVFLNKKRIGFISNDLINTNSFTNIGKNIGFAFKLFGNAFAEIKLGEKTADFIVSSAEPLHDIYNYIVNQINNNHFDFEQETIPPPSSDELDEYYAILGISKNASEEEIKKAFRKKSFEIHPDTSPDIDESKQTEEFQKIKDARNELIKAHQSN